MARQVLQHGLRGLTNVVRIADHDITQTYALFHTSTVTRAREGNTCCEERSKWQSSRRSSTCSRLLRLRRACVASQASEGVIMSLSLDDEHASSQNASHEAGQPVDDVYDDSEYNAYQQTAAAEPMVVQDARRKMTRSTTSRRRHPMMMHVIIATVMMDTPRTLQHKRQ